MGQPAAREREARCRQGEAQLIIGGAVIESGAESHLDTVESDSGGMMLESVDECQGRDHVRPWGKDESSHRSTIRRFEQSPSIGFGDDGGWQEGEQLPRSVEHEVMDVEALTRMVGEKIERVKERSVARGRQEVPPHV